MVPAPTPELTFRISPGYVTPSRTGPGGAPLLLEIQQYACAMCRTPFEEEQPIFIDHNHACCPDEKSSCGRCVHGLLCLSCNTALGVIERKYDLARAYLDSPPGQLVVRVEQAA